jgi:paraquat-inducible protein B
VEVGAVKEIGLVLSEKDISVLIPVVIELEPERFTTGNGVVTPKRGEEQRRFIDRLVDHGLRAQLQMQSFVTGQLLVEFDFHPDKPARFAKVQSPYIQLPTIPSDLEALTEKIEELPLEVMVNKMAETLEGVETLVNSPEVRSAVKSLDATLKEFETLAQSMDRRLESADRNLGATLGEAKRLLGNIDRQMTPLLASLQETSAEGRKTFEGAQKTMTAVDGAIGEQSEIRLQLLESLQELSTMANSLRTLTDYLEQNPDALLRGKSERGGER